MNAQFAEMSMDLWLASYKDDHRDLLVNDPGFAHWLDEEYVPIAGGWQY